MSERHRVFSFSLHGGLKPGLRVVVTRLLSGLHHGRAGLRVVDATARYGDGGEGAADPRSRPIGRLSQLEVPRSLCRSPPQLARGLLPTTSVVAAHEINSEWMALYGSRLTPQSFELGCPAVCVLAAAESIVRQSEAPFRSIRFQLVCDGNVPSIPWP